MPNKNKLSIYLLKSEIVDIEDIFDDVDSVEVFHEYEDGSTAYYVPSHTHEPNWLQSFFHRGADGQLLQANSRVVLLKHLKTPRV